MNETRWNMSALRNLDLSEVSIVEKPETHYLVTVPISQGIPFEQEIEKGGGGGKEISAKTFA